MTEKQEFERFIRTEFSNLTLDKLRMFKANPPFDYNDLFLIYQAAKESCRAEIERKDKALCFFKSVIKSGEPWTGECEEVFQKALSEEE